MITSGKATSCLSVSLSVSQSVGILIGDRMFGTSIVSEKFSVVFCVFVCLDVHDGEFLTKFEW